MARALLAQALHLELQQRGERGAGGEPRGPSDLVGVARDSKYRTLGEPIKRLAKTASYRSPRISASFWVMMSRVLVTWPARTWRLPSM